MRLLLDTTLSSRGRLPRAAVGVFKVTSRRRCFSRREGSVTLVTTLLDRPVTTYHEVAAALAMPPATLKMWIDGGVRSGRHYEPVLRSESTGDPVMTWGEIVEARYLRAYRRLTSLQRIRPFVAALRAELEVPYPLAHFRPFVDSNRRLLVNLQEQLDLPEELWLVFEGRSGQYVLNQAIEKDYLDQVEFDTGDTDEALRIFPLGKGKPVVIDPRVSSGAPTVQGVRTALLAERFEKFGESAEELASEFDLAPDVVRQAISFEYAA